MSRRLLEAEVGPLDTLYILRANTSGKPEDVLVNKIAGASHNPRESLASAWQTLQKRFGDYAIVARALLNRLNDFPIIRSCYQVEQFHLLYDLCSVLQINKAYCSELKCLDLQQGMSLVWGKLPESV